MAEIADIDPTLFLNLCRLYAELEEHTPRSKIYRVAKQLIEANWGKAEGMADGVSVFLIAWKCHPYRYGDYDFRGLEAALRRHLTILNTYRKRELSSLSGFDTPYVTEIFNDLAEALADDGGENGPNPIGAGMALHIVVPSFFPLWDGNVARFYVGDYENDPPAKYLQFCLAAQRALKVLHADAAILKYVNDTGRPLLKLFDEYNYMRYTLGYGEGEAR